MALALVFVPLALASRLGVPNLATNTTRNKAYVSPLRRLAPAMVDHTFKAQSKSYSAFGYGDGRLGTVPSSRIGAQSHIPSGVAELQIVSSRLLRLRRAQPHLTILWS